MLVAGLLGGAGFGFRARGAGIVGAGEALEVLFGGAAGGVERGVLGPGKNLRLACALDDTVVNFRVEALITAEVGEEISAAQAFIADHVGAIRI